MIQNVHPQPTTIQRLGSVSLVVLLIWAASAGCGNPDRVPPSDVAAAESLVRDTFKAWQAGSPVRELAGGRPPVYVADDWWHAGFELDDFQIEGNGELVGTNVRVTVTLNGTHPKWGKRRATLPFLVTTTPALTIAREDR